MFYILLLRNLITDINADLIDISVISLFMVHCYENFDYEPRFFVFFFGKYLRKYLSCASLPELPFLLLIIKANICLRSLYWTLWHILFDFYMIPALYFWICNSVCVDVYVCVCVYSYVCVYTCVPVCLHMCVCVLYLATNRRQAHFLGAHFCGVGSYVCLHTD